MVQVLRALHTCGANTNVTGGVCTVLTWVVNDPGHKRGWDELVTAWNGAGVAAACNEQLMTVLRRCSVAPDCRDQLPKQQ
jgi:hypothetical protein